MRVKTGETATTRLKVDVFYRCSVCGEDNLVTETITGSAHTGTIMGINLDQNLSAHAAENLQENLSTILDQDNPQRFRVANFTCKCRNCRHAEPWANMNCDDLQPLYTISRCVLSVSIFMLLTGLISASFNAVHCVFLALLCLSIAGCRGVQRHKTKRLEKMEQEIAELPLESLPTILPHSKERHSIFNRNLKVTSSGEVTYNKWVCRECGTENSVQYAQCKKCGKYKSS